MCILSSSILLQSTLDIVLWSFKWTNIKFNQINQFPSTFTTIHNDKQEEVCLQGWKSSKETDPHVEENHEEKKGVYLLGYIDYSKVRRHCLDPTDPMFPALHTCDCECEWLSGSMNQPCH